MTTRATIIRIVACGLLLTAAGCREHGPLELADLTPGERLYFDRVVAVERARSVALVDRDAGDALLDSLAAAWGDSAAGRTADGLGTDPRRAEALHQLLLRVVTAEQDSLLWDPGADRLRLPLPDPDRPGRERPEAPAGSRDGAVPRTATDPASG